MNRGIVIAIVVVVVACMVGVAFFFLGQSNDGGEDNLDVAYHTGDYVEWTWSVATPGSTTSDPYSIQRFTVVEIDGDLMTINRTYYNPSRVVLYSNEYQLPSNTTTFGSITTIHIGISLSNLTTDATDVISTNWGNVTADHYTWTNPEGGIEVVTDVWIVSNILLKMVTPGTVFNTIIELTDSNFEQIDSL